MFCVRFYITIIHFKNGAQIMTCEEIAGLGIKGFLDAAEGQRLYELAMDAAKLGPCLEVGGYCGLSAAYLGLGCQAVGGILFSLDHHRGSEEQQPGQAYYDPELYDEVAARVDTFRSFRTTLERTGLLDTVIPVVASSMMAVRHWTTPLALVFIDGGHSYSDAFSDYTAWMPHVMPGGYLLVHDIFLDVNEGGQAPRFIYNRALDSGLFDELPMTKTLGVLRRRGLGYVPQEVLAIRDWG